MNLKKSIEVCCAQQQMPRSELARRAGIRPTRVTQIKATNAATTTTLRRLSDALGIPLSTFIAEGED